MVGHLVAYPVGFCTAVAAMPLGMVLRRQELMDAEATGAKNSIVRDAAEKLSLSALEAAQVELVLEVCLVASLVTLSLIHLVSLPWAIAAARQVRLGEAGLASAQRGFKLFTMATLVTFAVLILGGLASWIWVFSL